MATPHLSMPATHHIALQVFSGHNGPVTAGAFTSDGKSIVSVGGEGDCTLRVWNPKTGACTLTVQVGVCSGFVLFLSCCPVGFVCFECSGPSLGYLKFRMGFL